MNKLFKILWLNLTNKDKRQFFFVVTLTFISSLLEVFSIGMVIPLITVLIEPSKLMEFSLIKEVAYFFNIYQSKELILPIIGTFVFVTIMSAVIRILSIKISADFSFSIGSDLSIKAYHNILHRSYSEHKNVNSSEDISKLVSKIGTVIQSLIFPSVLLLSAFVMIFIISIFFLFISFKLTVSLVIGLMLIYSLVTLYFKKRLKENSSEIASMQNKQVQIVQESVGGIQDVIINNSYDYFNRIYSKIDRNLRQRQASNVVVSHAPRYLIESISIVFLILSSYYFAFVNEIISKDMILPTFVTVAIALQRILPIAQQLYRSWANIEGNKQSLFDVLELLKIFEPSIKNENVIFNKEICLKNLSYKYNNSEKLILNNINLTIKKGEKIGVIGGTGSGKSTLIDIIMGLLDPTTGEIKLDDMRLEKNNSVSWHNHISHVPQNIYILDSDFYQNIAFGSDSKDIDKLKVKKAGETACIDEFIYQKVNGYSENVGERGSKLSGGQRQRIGIARCIYKDSSLIILDEATSSLDRRTEEKVMKNIFNLNKEHTILIIAHRLSTLKECDRVLELENGFIKRIGKYEEIISDK